MRENVTSQQFANLIYTSDSVEPLPYPRVRCLGQVSAKFRV